MTENVVQEVQSIPRNDFQHMQYQIAKMPICAGCQEYIGDKHCLKMDDKTWHNGCLKCCYCGAVPSDSCYFKNGKVFCCVDHYKRTLSTVACAGCGTLITNCAPIMQICGYIYHEVCYVCVNCRRGIPTYEACRVVDGELHCNVCAKFMCPCEEADDVLSHIYKQCGAEDQQQMKRERTTSLPIDPKAPTRYGLDYGRDHSSGYQPQKAKRMRTSFTNDQLSRMKELFNINRNPDASMLQKLAKTTVLPKRTLQIWFQNTRAKHRRKEKTDSTGNKTKNDSVTVKIENDDSPDDEIEQLALDSTNSIDSKQESDKGDGQSTSGSVLEFDSRSPDVESFSGDSRSDAAESSSTPSMQWTLDGLYQPDYQNLPSTSYVRNDGGLYHCADELEEHIQKVVYNSDSGDSRDYSNYSKYISSSKQSYTEMYNSLAR